MELCKSCKYGRRATISIDEKPASNNKNVRPKSATVFMCVRPWTARKDRDTGTCSEFKEKGENLQCQMEKKLSG